MVCKTKKVGTLVLAASLMLTTLTGCSTDSITNSINSLLNKDADSTQEDTTNTFDISSETSTLGINAKDPKLLSKLQNNKYYILHNDVYYPVYYYYINSAKADKLDISNQTNDWRMLFYTTENELNIPTLYEGDKLVYYSTDVMLNYLTWERYYDLGYTLGMANIHENITGRCYVNLDNDDLNILPDGGLADAANVENNNIMIDKVGGTQLTSDFLSYGVISGIEKDKDYDVELYNGTQFAHYTGTGNYHVFHAYEMFASIDYEPLQDFLYEIKIPEYFVNGYYDISEKGLFRLVRGTSYDDNTDFNEQLLYQYKEDAKEDEYIKPFCYSDFPELNYFTSHKEGTLGYTPLEEDSEDENPNIAEDEETDENETKTIKQSIIKEFDLWLPKDQQCTIKVKSKSGEKTGNIEVIFPDGSKKTNQYDFINDEYLITLNGKDEHVTLRINGFFSGYTIDLINAVQYTGQDGASTDSTEDINTTEGGN